MLLPASRNGIGPQAVASSSSSAPSSTRNGSRSNYPAGPKSGVHFNQRRETVEHPFGTIKQWMNQGAFLMRGLEKVRAEFSLTALAYNLRRVLNIVGLQKMIAALA